jgi:poly(A) polymerase
VIEVSTFRRQAEPEEGDTLIRRDNTFGTPEEDAFRRDFTINALAYDIATFSIIDFVGGLEDLRAGIVRSIGDPDVRLNEDPVRMIRAIAIAARLEFTIEPALLQSIRRHRREIAKSSLPRLIEEYYKILRQGSAEKAFRQMAEVGLLEPISMELHKGAADPLWHSLAAVDEYRRQFESTPDTLSNAILLGSLLVPLGISLHPPRTGHDLDASEGSRSKRTRHPPGPRLGDLPLARRDVERLRQIISLQRRLRDLAASERAQRSLAHRGIFREALTWMEIHGDSPDVVEHWMGIIDEGGAPEPGSEDSGDEGELQPALAHAMPFKKRRRRRRRGRRGGGGGHHT